MRYDTERCAIVTTVREACEQLRQLARDNKEMSLAAERLIAAASGEITES